MKKLFTFYGVASVFALAATSAIAGGVNWSVNIGVGGVYPPPPVYYPPPPMYYPPPPMYYPPPPINNNYSNYYAPPIIYGNAAPVYPAPPGHYGPPPVILYRDRDRPRPHDPRYGDQRGPREYRNYGR